MHPLVVHCKRSAYDVYIGRPSQWGNPFHVAKGATEEEREEVLGRYRGWVEANPELVATVKEQLKGKILGCWCSPKRCHGEILAEIANQ